MLSPEDEENMLSPQGEDEEFEFYLKFAKPLVLNLPETSDRIKAATWIRYLKNDTTDPALRGEYLKLLLFVLQRRKLFGPFASIPDENQPLQKIPDEINIQDVAKNFVEVDKKVLKETLERGGFGEWPPYTTACSSDLTEYVSSQRIPNFGIQAYYAISRDPLQQWDHFEEAIFPIGEDLDSSQPESSVVDTASPDISCFVSPNHGEPILPQLPPRPMPRIQAGGPKDNIRSKGLEDVSPKTRNEISPTIDEFRMEPRVPPIWGSNLVNVKDSPSPTTQQLSLKDLDIEISDQDMLDFFNDDIDAFEAFLDEASNYLEDTKTPPESATLPDTEPCSQINIDDLYDTMSRYDEDMRIIDAKLPATTPQRSPSPKRPCDLIHNANSSMQENPMSRCPRPTAIHPPQPRPTNIRPPQPRPITICPPQPTPISRSPTQARPMLQNPTPDQLYDAIEQAASGQAAGPEQSCAAQLRPTSSRPSSPNMSFNDKDTLQFYNDLLKYKIPSLCPDDAEKSEKEKQAKEVVAAVQVMLEEMNQPTTSILKTTGDLMQESIMSKSGKDLEKDTFDDNDYCWVNDIPRRSGVPQYEQENPTFGDSFECWTDDPDKNFTYCPPSFGEYETPEPDPYAAERNRRAHVDRTPPSFSHADEFDEESSEEPIWTSAVQYHKYKKDPSPFIAPRR